MHCCLLYFLSLRLCLTGLFGFCGCLLYSGQGLLLGADFGQFALQLRLILQVSQLSFVVHFIFIFLLSKSLISNMNTKQLLFTINCFLLLIRTKQLLFTILLINTKQLHCINNSFLNENRLLIQKIINPFLFIC